MLLMSVDCPLSRQPSEIMHTSTNRAFILARSLWRLERSAARDESIDCCLPVPAGGIELEQPTLALQERCVCLLQPFVDAAYGNRS